MNLTLEMNVYLERRAAVSVPLLKDMGRRAGDPLKRRLRIIELYNGHSQALSVLPDVKYPKHS